MGKIEKLNKDIEKLKKEIEAFEDKIDEARKMLKDGRLDKDQWTRARLKYQEKIRVNRSTINRKENVRLHLEKKEKEKREEEKDKKK